MRINQSYWWEPRFSILLKVALKNFKRMLLVHRFDGFFCFLNWFFKAFVLNWLKNLRAQFGLYGKRAGVRTPWTTPPSSLPLDARLMYIYENYQKQGSKKHGQTGRRSSLLVSVSLLCAQRSSSKNPYHFISLKHQ